MKNGQTRSGLKRRGRHVVVFARRPHADVGVAVVGINHGIGVGAVAIVGTPHLRLVLSACRQRDSSQYHQKSFLHRSLFILSL